MASPNLCEQCICIYCSDPDLALWLHLGLEWKDIKVVTANREMQQHEGR